MANAYVEATPVLIAAVLLSCSSSAKAQLKVEEQLDQIDRTFICPESLPSDEARQTALDLFIEQVRAVQPGLTIRQLVTYRERLLRKHNCTKTLEYEREHFGTKK